jgi:hypothetical protein
LHDFIEGKDCFSFVFHTFALAEQMCRLYELFGLNLNIIDLNIVIVFGNAFINLKGGKVVNIIDGG